MLQRQGAEGGCAGGDRGQGVNNEMERWVQAEKGGMPGLSLEGGNPHVHGCA